jgi:hypothetical protein
MTQKNFIKDGKIRTYQVDSKRVYTTIEVDGRWVSNPSVSVFKKSGWKEYVVPTPIPILPTYAELVEQYIREHGYETYGAELAVINNYADDPGTYVVAYEEYRRVREEAKEWAKQQEHRDE